MVKESTRDGRKVFFCEECGFGYADRKTASKCEEWCSTRGTCSMEITKHAIIRP